MAFQHLRQYFVYVKAIARLCLIAVFVTSTISVSFRITWTSVLSLVCLLVSFKPKINNGRSLQFNVVDNDFKFNPFKGKTGKKGCNPEKEQDFHQALEDYLLYDATTMKSLKNFMTMKNQSQCVFAKKATVWGSPDYKQDISLEENIKIIYPTFLKFISCCEELGLDAFLIELPGQLYGQDIKVFGEAVRRTLLTLKTCDNLRKWRKSIRISYPTFTSSSNHDKLLYLNENTSKWDRKSWVFEMYKATFFITTFAPFYPETSSRYNFGLADCYILFQPEVSFAIHDLPEDTPVTNWQKPLTVRDKIRKAFRDSGREYTPPLVKELPMVYEIVPPIELDDKPIKWWVGPADDLTSTTQNS